MKHASLFSGIGGFDLAAEWMGWENVFHCEWNPFGQKILSYYWPKAKSYHDITKTDFTIHEGTIDILTGGFPCQPYSTAGKRKGKADDRHLWPEMLRAIREIKPRWVVGENVLGLVNWNDGLVFEEVQSDLEAEGYEVQPYILPAASVQAPHRRDRVWFVAYSGSNGHQFGGLGENRRSESESGRSKRKRLWQDFGRISEQGVFADTAGAGLVQRRQSRRGEIQAESRTGLDDRSKYASVAAPAPHEHPNGQRFKKPNLTAFANGSQRLGSFGSIENWAQWPSQSPVCSGNDGLSGELDGITLSKWRTESIKGAGNAIVPQVALQIFEAIQKYEDHPELN